MLLVTGSVFNALVSQEKDATAPSEIVFIPEGSNKIFPLSNPDGVTINLPPEKGTLIAATLNAALQKRLAQTVQPWFDIEHTRKFPASGYPKAFRYEPGKGIMAAVEWSGSGRKAIENKDVRYFSPEFFIDDNGVPSGLPERGPLGGLVTEPAFREIGAIAASDAGENQPNSTTPKMKLIFAALAISAAAENAESEAVTAINQLKIKAADADRLEKENADLQKKVTAAEAAAETVRKERADTLVKAAVADGRILAKDTEKQDKFREKISAGDTFAEEILAQLPKLNAGIDKPVITAGQTSHVAAGATDLETKAKALVTAGSAKTLEDAICIVASEDPQAYSEYLKTLG